jgi:sugar phosphate isomerase/epimerase
MRLSVQCYTLRAEFAKDVWKTFASLREMGFLFVELAGTYELEPKELRKGLDALDLKISGSHVGLDALEEKLEQTIEDNYTLDNRYIILPWVDKEAYGAGWDVFAHRLDAIGERVREAGLRFAYHNHAFEFEEQNGRPGLDLLYEGSSPEHVQAQLDVAWVQHGGQDPADYIRRYADRCPLVHLKDITAEGKDVIPGGGTVDWVQVLAACREADVEFGAIEMDNPPDDPWEDVKACVDFFRTRGISF